MRGLAPLVGVVWAVAAGCGGSQTAVCSEGTPVELQVIEGSGEGTLALVPVTIEGQGPYRFALDTGASVSAIDAPLANELGLDVVGSAGSVQGIVGSEQAELVEVGSWQIGDVVLDPGRMASLPLFGDRERAPRGLLGSDVLSRFSAVCVDYGEETLRLGSS